MRNLITKFAFWLLRKVGAVVLVLPPSLVPVLNRARKLVAVADAVSAPGTSGQYKRGPVYSRLLKEFPKLPKKDAGIIIELAVRDA